MSTQIRRWMMTLMLAAGASGVTAACEGSGSKNGGTTPSDAGTGGTNNASGGSGGLGAGGTTRGGAGGTPNLGGSVTSGGNRNSGGSGTGAVAGTGGADASVTPDGASPDGGLVDATADGAGVGFPAGTNCPFCPPGQKICGALCVAVDDPKWGCGPSCKAACAIPFAVAGCSAGACSIVRCAQNRADCNGTASDGCEVDLNAAATCGACSTKCGATEKCTPTGCAAACTFPQTDCGDGSCRDLSTDRNACGSCSGACPAAGALMACSAATCVCEPGSNTYLGPPTISCVDEHVDVRACGATHESCPAPFGAVNGRATCFDGSCVAACPLSFALCGGSCVNPLADAANCGQCGHACAIDQICATGSCVSPSDIQIVTGLSQPEDLVVDDTTLYFTDIGDNTVRSVPKTGGAPTLLASGQAKPIRIAVDDAYVYWSSQLGGAILRARKDGTGAAVPIAPANLAQGLLVDKTHVYWANGGDDKVYSVPKSGGTVTELAAAVGSKELVTDGTSLYAGGYQIAKTGGSRAFLVAGGGGFPTISSGSTIFVPGGLRDTRLWGFFAPTGDTPTFNVGTVVQGGPLAVDNCTVYGTGGGIWFMRLGDYDEPFDGIPSLVTLGQSRGRLVLDESYVYWVDADWIGRVHK